jgi:uracil phosphoribosyltransferase
MSDSYGSNESSPCKDADSGLDLRDVDDVEKLKSEFESHLKILEANDNVKALLTVIRDKNTSRNDFVFYTDRLIRMVVEEGLNCLSYVPATVTTPTECTYEGYGFEHMNCGVSIIRSGEAMEKGLRQCCRSMRIGKILIRTEKGNDKPVVYYARFPPNIEKRNILLMYPILETGKTVVAAIDVLKEHGVLESKIFLITLFTTPLGIRTVLNKYPNITLLTTELYAFCPTHFGNFYFGCV